MKFLNLLRYIEKVPVLLVSFGILLSVILGKQILAVLCIFIILAGLVFRKTYRFLLFLGLGMLIFLVRSLFTFRSEDLCDLSLYDKYLGSSNAVIGYISSEPEEKLDKQLIKLNVIRITDSSTANDLIEDPNLVNY
ncbi:hypothetical protein JW887_03075 [Candidatus Dojkabacteria bacterium]|nr:hypothetical protein [Candidatus Dojkabacteria bacterium]